MRATITLLSLTLFACSTFAQSQPAAAPGARPTTVAPCDYAALREAETPKARQRLSDIADEAKHNTHTAETGWADEWAGIYGANHVVLGLAPKSGFAYIDDTCTGAFQANNGDIIETFPGGVKLRLAIDPQRESVPFCSETLYFAKRGQRHYLVPERRMIEFCDYCNYKSGAESEETLEPPVKVGDADKPHGPAAVPERYTRYIFREPLLAHITRLGDLKTANRSVGGTVTLDRGDADGVYPGLRLGFRGDNGVEVFQVTAAQDHSCTATFQLRTPLFGETTPPAIGQTLSTKAR